MKVQKEKQQNTIGTTKSRRRKRRRRKAGEQVQEPFKPPQDCLRKTEIIFFTA